MQSEAGSFTPIQVRTVRVRTTFFEFAPMYILCCISMRPQTNKTNKQCKLEKGGANLDGENSNGRETSTIHPVYM